MDTSRFQPKKGQALSIDASFAALIAISILFLGLAANSEAALRAEQAQEQVSSEARALSIADFLIKQGAAAKSESAYGVTAQTHVIDGQLLTLFDFQNSCAELLSPDDSQSCTGAACIRRPVIIHSSNEAGYLVVCAN